MDYLNLLTSWTSIFLITLISIYLYSTRNFKYWRSRGVNGPKPVPFVGNLNQLFAKSRCAYGLDNYKKFGNIYGLFEGCEPVLSVGEPELIRDITVKDLDKFVDCSNTSLFDHLFDRLLLTSNSNRWKQIRSIVLPTFSNKNMNKMQVLIDDCLNRLEIELIKCINSNKNMINMRQFMANYTIDVFAICMFGTEIDAYNSSKKDHIFIKSARALLQWPIKFQTYLALNYFVPSLANKYISFVFKDIIHYFKSILRLIIAEREIKNELKNIDFLQLLIDAKNKKESKDVEEDIRHDFDIINESPEKREFHFDETHILATSLTFLLAGYEPIVSTLSHLFQELALNADVQQRLFEEIQSFGQNPDYETIEKMAYLDACVSETLRMYSPLVLIQRTADEDYDLGDIGLVISKGMSVQIPIYAIHHNQQYYPNPNQFNPNRFTPEHRYPRIPYTYLPFGTVAQNCIGMRFALMDIKTTVVHIVSKFEFFRTQNTKTEFKYKKFVLFTQALDMGTVKVKRRL